MASKSGKSGKRWASLAPFGIGQTKPQHFKGMAKVLWKNKSQLPYAWRILNRGVCDGCALGTTGLKDWTIDSVHLCMIRLELMWLNTMSAIDNRLLEDLSELKGKSSRELHELGRLSHPLVRRKGDPGFRKISWEEATQLAAQGLAEIDPVRSAFYLTSRGIPNETYYVAQKAARFYGSPNVDNSARLCHAASTVGMKRAVGYGASTGSYRDWLHADLIVFFGSNAANNQPVTTKYLYEAKKNGAQIAIVNPFVEPGMKRYWIPSIPDSAVFGTRLGDQWFEVDTGGDLAFLTGVLKALQEIEGGVDQAFIDEQTLGFGEAAAAARSQVWADLERKSGSSEDQIRSFAQLLVDRPKAIFVWSMGLTQHAHGVETIQALMNVGLARGLVGKPDSGLTPIRGHSGVQGGAEVGCVPLADSSTLDHLESVWGFPLPRGPGLATMAQIAAAANGDLDAFWIVGGNFLETVPGKEQSLAALNRPKLRIHQDIVLSSSMLVDPSETVLILPTTTRYEIPGGVTETTTERRIVFSPEIPGRRIGEAQPEWTVFSRIMGRVAELRGGSGQPIQFEDTAAIRQEIARAVPLYKGIEDLEKQGDQFQWGGPTLFEDGEFATVDGKAHFHPIVPGDETARSEGEFHVSTRRGHQFNSIIQSGKDSLTGLGRESVLMSAEDCRSLDLQNGTRIRLTSRLGAEFEGRVAVVPIKAGNLEVHWPEGMSLLDERNLDGQSGEPDYGTVVTVVRAE